MIKFISIFLICLTYYSFGQELYPHKLDEQKLSELQKTIQHQTKKPERWTFETDQEWQDAVKKFDKNKRGSSKEKAKGYESKEYTTPETNKSPSNYELPNLKIGPITKVIIYVVLGALLVILLYYLFINSNYKSVGKKYTPIDLEEIAPSEITTTALESMLTAAIKEENYRKAIRIYYLFIIKDLADKKWIHWEKQKTNNHYLMEMSTKKEYAHFSTAVTYFEFIWYGKRKITVAQFDIIKPHFTKLLKALDIK
ncbi:hypothetical protein DNU06_13350 [Putridiphycobacter roseus]|uniref:DUF4129 domain-containing protein n=1 Tax=Putridiphycobacter roseus TaxID=2219161 RepID=A0A2W1MY42_9FLAO|nr:hypothetical protein [Putridiphycobacter roseus]PZE16294.1 hypothetical protein DNU06_13350 [Putridiphycobacter roseus]